MIPTRGTFVGICLIALATLTYEVLLTRIFSVTMWYHFAFVAISIAMFGVLVLVVLLTPSLSSVFRDREPLSDRCTT